MLKFLMFFHVNFVGLFRADFRMLKFVKFVIVPRKLGCKQPEVTLVTLRQKEWIRRGSGDSQLDGWKAGDQDSGRHRGEPGYG